MLRCKLFDLSDSVQCLCVRGLDDVRLKNIPSASTVAAIPTVSFYIFSSQVVGGSLIELSSEKPFRSVKQRDSFFDKLTRTVCLIRYNNFAFKNPPLKIIKNEE